MTGLIDAIPNVVFFKDTNGVYLVCNQAFSEFLGKPKLSIVGKTDFELFSDELAENFRESDKRILISNRPIYKEEYIECQNGQKILMETLKMPMYGQNNQIVGIMGISTEITDIKKLKDSLIESKAQQKAILDNMPFFAWLKDKQGKFVATNEPFVRSFNLTEKDIIGKTDFDICSKEYAELYAADDLEVITTGKQKCIEEIIIVDGKEKWFETFKKPILNEAKSIIGTTGLARDITDRKQYEQQLILKDKMLLAVTESVNELVKNQDFADAILKAFNMVGEIINVDRIYLFENSFNTDMGLYIANQKYEWVSKEANIEINNLDPQIVSKTMSNFIYELAQNKPIIGPLRDLDPKIQEVLLPHKITSIMVFPIFIENYFWGFIGFDEYKTERIWTESEKAVLSLFSASIANILERRQKREKEKINEKRINAILNNMRDGIITINENCIIESCNPAIETMFGYSFTETIGKKIHLLLPHVCSNPEKKFMCNDKCLINKCFESKKEFVSPPELHALKKFGTDFPVEIDIGEINNEDRSLYLLVIKDITQRKKVDRMKNEFISTVSHELRTPLTSICGSLDLLETGVFGEIPEEGKELLKVASESSTRLIQLINDILDISKIEEGKMEYYFEVLKFSPIIKQAIDAVQSFSQQFNITLELENNAPDVKIRIDKNRIIQVITNLLSNASKFSPGGSTVKISVKTINDTVRVAIKDKGSGIPKEFQDRIFEKFAQADSSDSRQKPGTGLGLSICKAIIDKLEGKIDYRTSSSGTTFYFELPVYKE